MHRENLRNVNNVGRLEIRRGFRNFWIRCMYVIRGNIVVVNRFSLDGCLQAPRCNPCGVMYYYCFYMSAPNTALVIFCGNPVRSITPASLLPPHLMQPLLSPLERFVEFLAICDPTTPLSVNCRL